jgi:hypothetical protein
LMLTIFAIPKPFEGQISVIQKNAIQSWTKLHPDCEVILLGDEPGTGTVAAEFKIKHVPLLKLNEFGTPLVSSAFELAQAVASYPIICYVNADIILLSDFSPGIQKVSHRFDKFLMVGQRWNIDYNQPIDFIKPDWETDLKQDVAKNGLLFTNWGIDYFAFHVGQYLNMPLFAVGRPSWDNWMIYRARTLRIPVIDATGTVTAIHQNHGYQHVPKSVGGTFYGPEADRNMELAGGPGHIFSIMDADLRLTSNGFERPIVTYYHITRYFQTLSVLKPGYRFVAKPLHWVLNSAARVTRKIKKISGLAV